MVKKRDTAGLTLTELMVVISIIGILSALLMKGEQLAMARVKRISCENNLRQTGIAFNIFQHDHAGKFPMQVPVAQGGAQDFVQNGYLVPDAFYFSYRLFQPISNELTQAKALLCKDEVSRSAATDFASLQNSNLSYFVGVDADFSLPTSLLAGDRNIACSPVSHPTILKISAATSYWWTQELHQSKGNVLFSDGHVEEWVNNSFAAFKNDSLAPGNLFLPTSK